MGVFAWLGHVSLILSAVATFTTSLATAFPKLGPVALIFGAICHAMDDVTFPKA